MKIGIIGLGLLGGSMAIALRRVLKADIYGQDKYHFDKAKDLGLIQFPLTEDQLAEMDIIIIATPVDTISDIARNILDKAALHTLVFDVGSTKHKMAQALANHPKRRQFLLAHPIAGTEYSGPEAAFGSLFDGKINIICDVQETAPELLDIALKLFDALNMQTIQMDSASHDEHIAYVSHLSHISSFMLGKTVLDLEKNTQNIFTMAGSGFASTVRLAKSSPQTWTPIFLENKKPILKALDEYIDNLQDFKAML
ncbi:MAG TPA: prephenate dehydrogenase, partial [Flavobacteriales bacterium]|nr:prephenate dehydrogenase [Flavobacteriales bacterium]